MKVALVGSAPSSVRLAPYEDPSWSIWTCSPGAVPNIRRSDMHFEIHRWEPGKPWFQPDYIAWMGKVPAVWMIAPVPEIPTSRAYPKDRMIERYGPFFFTSSLAFMLAMALSQDGVEEIGLWGVDMSATEEYGYQRAGCQYFLQLAALAGIKVTVPPESDLLRPAPLYGFCEDDPMHVKLLVRSHELEARIADCNNREMAAAMEKKFLQGAHENNEYVRKTWIGQGWVIPDPVLDIPLMVTKGSDRLEG